MDSLTTRSLQFYGFSTPLQHEQVNNVTNSPLFYRFNSNEVCNESGPFHGYPTPKLNKTKSRLEVQDSEEIESEGTDSSRNYEIREINRNKKKTRSFTPRKKYKRLQIAAKKLIRARSLVTNCSTTPLTAPQDQLLSCGLNFVPTPKNVNTTLMMARWQCFTRTVRWNEFWHGKLEGEVSNGPKRVFKTVKTNLLPYPPPKKHLSTFLSAFKDEIFLAPLNKAQSNQLEEEQEAMKELVDKKRRGEIKIVPMIKLVA